VVGSFGARSEKKAVVRTTPLAYSGGMATKILVTVVETPSYLRRAEKLLSEEERFAVVNLVAEDPECGNLMRGTGGVRKMRFAREGGGKSGGYRVVYFFHDPGMPLFLLALFAKSGKANLTTAECNQLRTLTTQLVQQYRGGKK
jgi:hypothetical protein